MLGTEMTHWMLAAKCFVASFACWAKLTRKPFVFVVAPLTLPDAKDSSWWHFAGPAKFSAPKLAIATDFQWLLSVANVSLHNYSWFRNIMTANAAFPGCPEELLS